MIEIQIKYETRSLLSKKNIIEKVARQFLLKKRIKNIELSILITTDKNIKILNKKYRNINKPTDVLSFSQQPRGQVFGVPTIVGRAKYNIRDMLLGDIIISADTLKRQAKIYNNSIDGEIKLLVIHGIKHLLGYHHENLDKK